MILRTFPSLTFHVPAALEPVGFSYTVLTSAVQHGSIEALEERTDQGVFKKKLGHWLKADSCIRFACVIFFLLSSVYPSFL